MLFKTFAQNKRKFKKFQNNVAQHRENKFQNCHSKQTNFRSTYYITYLTLSREFIQGIIQGSYPGNYPGKGIHPPYTPFQAIQELSREGYTGLYSLRHFATLWVRIQLLLSVICKHFGGCCGQDFKFSTVTKFSSDLVGQG